MPEGGLPGVYRDFLRRELWSDDRAWSRRFGPVLGPLAVAQDEGLTTEQLRLVAGRLGEEPMTRTAIREVTRTARQFLDSPGPDRPFRVYHQSFADFLVDPEQNPDFLIDAAETHGAIVAAYAAADPLSWDDYARRNLALHASKVGQLDHLLEDARFLLAADPVRLVPYLDAARSTPARATAAVYRQNAHHLATVDPPTRASQLELAAHHLGCRSLAANIADAVPDRPWQTLWCHGRRATGHQVLTGHGGEVAAVATGTLPDGTPVIVSGSDDRTVRAWRLADGTPAGEPLTGHGGPVKAVATGTLPDGTPVIVSGSDDRTVRVWRLADGTPVGEPLTGHTGWVEAVATGTLPDGTPVIVSGGLHGEVRVWRLADGTPVGEPLTGHGSPVAAVATGTLPDGTPVIVSGGYDNMVRVWRLSDGTPVGEPLNCHIWPVIAVAVGALPDGTPVIVGGCGDMVRVWRLAKLWHPGRGTADRPRRHREGGGDRDAAGRHPGHRQRRLRRHGAGVAAGRRHPGRGTADRPRRHREGGGDRDAAGRHPGHRQRQRRRPDGAGVAAGRRHPGRGSADRPRRLGELSSGRDAAGWHPRHRQRRRRLRQHGAGVAAGRRHPHRGAAARPHRRREGGSDRSAARMAPPLSSAPAATRCGSDGWPTAPPSVSRYAVTPSG